MIPIKKALKIVERETKLLGKEDVPIGSSVGLVLAQHIAADMDLPPFDRSQMDGYAVVSSDTVDMPVKLKIIGESAAGKGFRGGLKSGEAVRIMTGARVPKGADAVQRVELTREEDGIVTVLESVKKNMSIVWRGSEIRRGKVVFSAGKLITEKMIAVLASFGYAKVKVGKRPRVSIMGTGSEIVEITKKPGLDQIRNSNSVMLDVMSRRLGAETTILPIVRDDIADLKNAVRITAMSADVLLITGGVSVGKYDHTKTALTELGAEIFFEKLRLKPGKPTVFARLGKLLIFGLPGNPVSAATAFHLLAGPAIRRLQGARKASPASGVGIASETIKGTSDRDSYVPCQMAYLSTGTVEIRPLRGHGSSDFITYARADCMAVVARGTNVEKGTPVEFITLD
jgi:molybdopterin molybdotransferase